MAWSCATSRVNATAIIMNFVGISSGFAPVFIFLSLFDQNPFDANWFVNGANWNKLTYFMVILSWLYSVVVVIYQYATKVVNIHHTKQRTFRFTLCTRATHIIIYICIVFYRMVCNIFESLHAYIFIDIFNILWLWNRPNSQTSQCTCPISHRAPFRTEMRTFWSGWCIVEYGAGALWDLWDWSIRNVSYDIIPNAHGIYVQVAPN